MTRKMISATLREDSAINAELQWSDFDSYSSSYGFRNTCGMTLEAILTASSNGFLN
ncbi:hypothetical protein [Zhouia amylolytica]|uniref:hypothetical protein n=1 Tax=Zhouia amylolytica TaxID=376730 RepID=UPI0020CCB8D7|nr:hypothetical protein [Zhouia amylolytica]MCQ0110937.1 hypothetical protein [Zhouia amylolytica]